MKTISALLLSVFVVTSHAAESKVVDVKAEGFLREPLTGAVVKVPILAAIISEGDFKVLSGTREAFACVYLGKGAAAEIVTALKKAPRWAAKAKEVGLETSKDLLDLTSFSDGSIYGLKFVFSASEKGAESHVEIEMHDFETSRVVTIRLELEQVPKLIEVFQKVPVVFEEYKVQQAKAEQLQ